MSIEMAFSSQSAQPNLYSFFSVIKGLINNILDKYKYKNFLEDTSIDIESIAYNIGIKRIYPVPPLLIQYDHSHLTNNDIILLNKDDESEHRFSIAHEIAHYVLGRGKNNKVIVARAKIRPITENLEESFFNFSEFYKTTKYYSKVIAGLASDFIDKPVTSKNAFKFLMKTANQLYDEKIKPLYEELEDTSSILYTEDALKPLKDEIQEYIFETVEKVCEEEIADYFAANLLVPTERLLLLEDKSDYEIAQEFNVTLGCIQKRREEMENELYLIFPPKEHKLHEELKVSRGNVVGIGKVKIPTISMFDYNIKWLSFLDIQESETSFVSTCINLRIDGYGETKEEAENDMFESIIYFLCQNFSKLPFYDARENIYELYESDSWSKELWDVYHKAQAQLINNIKLKDAEYHENERKTDATNHEAKETYIGLAAMIQNILNGLVVHKTYFKET